MLTSLQHRVFSVCFSADGKFIASGSKDRTVKIWSVGSSGTFECESTLNVDGSISSLDFSPCGTKIAAACNDYDNDKYTVKILGSSSESAGTFECESTLTGHNAPVTQVEFIDADTVVSSSDDGTTRAWDVATGTQKAEFEGDKFSFTRSSGGDEQTVGAYVVTTKDNLVLVHALKQKESATENNHAVAFFRAPGVVQTLECAGDRIAVGCQNGEVLHLQAAWLVEEA